MPNKNYRTRAGDAFNQVDNYLTALKSLGIPSGENRNLDSNTPANQSAKLFYRESDESLNVFSEIKEEWINFPSKLDLLFINIKDYGAIGDGIANDTDAFYNALQVAKDNRNYLYFPDGDYNIIIQEDTVDMNGCIGLQGKGKMLIRSFGDPDKPIFKWSGDKYIISDEIQIHEKQTSFIIDLNQDIKIGDTIFVISDELMIEDSTRRYVKGERLTAKDYDPDTGVLITFEPTYYNINKAYLYHNSYRPRVQINDIIIDIIEGNDKKGLEIELGSLFVRNAEINGFMRFCLNISSSISRVSDCYMTSPEDPATSTGYCIQSSGLTDLIVYGCNLYGNRHGIACGDVGYWKGEDVYSQQGSLFAPSICKIHNCRVQGVSYAVDSHLGTTILEVYNCDIYGGIQAGGKETYVSFSRVNQLNSPATVRIGRDRPNGGNVYFGIYIFRNNDFYFSRRLFHNFSNCEILSINSNNSFTYGDEENKDGFVYSGGSHPLYFELHSFINYGLENNNTLFYLHLHNDNNKIKDLKFINSRIEFSFRDILSSSLTIDGLYVYGSDSYGFRTSTPITSGRFFNIILNNFNILNTVDALNITRAKSIKLISGQFKDNDNGLVLDMNLAGTIDVSVNSCIFLNNNESDILSRNGQVSKIFIIGSDFDSPKLNVPNSDILGKYGNININDRFNTDLTSASNKYYGEDDSTKDLTIF